MHPPRKVLVIDRDPANGLLLVQAVARKFPSALTELCHELGAAVEAAATQQLDIVVLHRNDEEEAVTIIGILKNIDAALPIVVVSGADRSEGVLRAGASGFLHYEKWHLIGAVVANVLAAEVNRQQSFIVRSGPRLRAGRS